jgi:hypothetical protein
MAAPACSHVWIDPEDPPIARTPYVPVIGPCRHQMKAGRVYVCRQCGLQVIATIDHAAPVPGVVDVRCYVCHVTLDQAGALFGCYRCRAVRMCTAHIAGVLEVGGIHRPLCGGCLTVH